MIKISLKYPNGVLILQIFDNPSYVFKYQKLCDCFTCVFIIFSVYRLDMLCALLQFPRIRACT